MSKCQWYIKVLEGRTLLLIHYREDMKVLESMAHVEDVLNYDESDFQNILYFSYEEFFEYFETLNIVVILNDYIRGRIEL